MVFVFAMGAESCNKTVLKKTLIITSKLLSYTTQSMSVINPPFISNFVLNIIHRMHNQFGQASWKTKRKHSQEKKTTCASSYLAIAAVFAMRRILELSHCCSLPANIVVVVQEFKWRAKTIEEWENFREAGCHPLKVEMLSEGLWWRRSEDLNILFVLLCCGCFGMLITELRFYISLTCVLVGSVFSRAFGNLVTHSSSRTINVEWLTAMLDATESGSMAEKPMRL